MIYNMCSWFYKTVKIIYIVIVILLLLLYIRYLYWNDQGSKRIERSKLDGSEREVIVDDVSYWPNQMTWHYQTR